MTAKINKDVTEDAEESVVAEEEEAEEPTPKPVKKKVRRVRVIEVIDDEDDDADLSDVLEALDEAEADEKPGPAPAPALAKLAKATKVAEDEAAAEPAPQVKADEPPAGPAGRTILGANPFVAGGAIVVIAALATLSIFLWISQSGLSGKQDTRDEIEKRVSEYGNSVLSLDRGNLQASIDRMKSFLTGDALDGAKKTDVATLKPTMDKNGVNFTSKTQAVYLGNVGGRFAGATLVFEWTIQSATGPQTVAGNHVKLDLVKQDGKWMISKQTPAGRESDGSEGTGVPGLGGTTPNPSTSPSPSTSGTPKK